MRGKKLSEGDFKKRKKKEAKIRNGGKFNPIFRKVKHMNKVFQGF